MISLLLACLALQDPSPHERERIDEVAAGAWTFESAGGWEAAHEARARAVDGVLEVEATGPDPYLHGPAMRIPGPLRVRLRMRSAGAGQGQLFWISEGEGFNEERGAFFEMVHDGAWHDYDVIAEAAGPLVRFRLDPGQGAGRIGIDEIRVFRFRRHPLEILKQEAGDGVLALTVKNHGPEARTVRAGGGEQIVAAGGTVRLTAPFPKGPAFPRAELALESEGLPLQRRAATLPDAAVTRDWTVLKSGAAELRLDPEGAGAWILLEGRPVAILAPLVEGVVRWEREGTLFRAPGVRIGFSADPAGFAVELQADREVEGPVLRVLGGLEQGLFAGIEHLGRGERSSSKLDLETPEHRRFTPPRRHVTMPLMAVVTERGGASLTWSDMTLQPVFAAPNVYDGTSDHRMALRGRRIEAIIRVAPGRLEDFILEAVRRRGLPPLPEGPADTEALALEALKGPLKTPGEEGWGHCAEPSWKRAPFADHASAWWRLTGEVPALPRLQPGGAHLADESVYFAAGRVEEWLRMRRSRVAGLLRELKPDGSFRYAGKLARGHSEDTASGYCAQRVVELLEFARWTGDAAALDGGLRGLDFLKRFDTPRGAQTWEMPLHTPDLLGAAWLVWANVRGFELSGRAAYLDEARRWALSGVPYLYQWSDRPVMTWATIAVLGATQWTAPNWIGLPVQWCGGVYGYALALLAPHDRTLDWSTIARGILVAGEQMLAPDGPHKGCLPDSFALATQERRGPFINPCALLTLRRALDGKPHGIHAAWDGTLRVASPFPVEVRDGRARIRAREGAVYSVLLNGAKTVTITSKGLDELAP